MRLLFDTNVLLHLAQGSTALTGAVRLEVLEESNTPCFSPVNIWQVHDLVGAQVPGLSVDPTMLYRGLMDNGYTEIPVTSVHIARAVQLRTTRQMSPLDRLLLAQAEVEGIKLITVSADVASLSDLAEFVELLPWRKRTSLSVQDDASDEPFSPEDYNGWTML